MCLPRRYQYAIIVHCILLMSFTVSNATAADRVCASITDDCSRGQQYCCSADSRCSRCCSSYSSLLDRVPTMIGDGFFGRSGPIRGPLTIDRLFVSANDLDAPAVLPAGNQMLTISEPGPVGIFSSAVVSVQQLQTLLRNGQPLPPATVAGQIVDTATLTTSGTVATIQTQLAGTPQAFDIIGLEAPPASYTTGVDGVFQGRNGAIGTTTYDNAASGALLQAGDDTLNGGDDLDAFYFYNYSVNVAIESPHAAAVRSGVIKVANGGTPLPRNRIYFQYGLFDGVGFNANGETVSRFVPGIERTFYDGMLSLEARFPFAATVGSDIVASPTSISNDSSMEWGDMSLFAKVLLHRRRDLALSGGLTLTIPTAEDLNVRTVSGASLLRVETDAVHFGPFLAALYAPNERFFAQGFLQYDFALNGNEVLVNADGNGLVSAGRLNDAAFLYLDAGIGYWINPPTRRGRATALMAELHYNGDIGNTDVVRTGNFQVGQRTGSIDTLNLTIGASTELNKTTILTAGYSAPIAGGSDEQYDGALQLNVEYRPR